MARRHTAALADHDHYASRRLVVVAAFDVVGFSTMVEANEDNALAAWRALRREIDPLITRAAAASSSRWATACWSSSPARSRRRTRRSRCRQQRPELAPERGIRLRLRCAIHMGEVTVEGTDLLGDGINIVSRLQQHAPTGGVLVSAAVMDLISGLIDAPIKDLGTLKLQQHQPPRACLLPWARASGRARRRRSTASSAGGRRSRCCPSSTRRPRRRRSYFSDGLVQDIIASLSCLPELVVISRSSTLRYRGSAPDPRQVRRDLRVRYMLSGSVRRAGHKVRFSAELADCERGTTIWSDRFAGEAADLFALQDELSARVVATITPQVQEAELRRVLRKRPESLDAYECVLRGLDLLYRFDDDRSRRRCQMFQRAMALDPNYGTAHALAASWYSVRIDQGLSPDSLADYAEADRLAGWR